SLSRSAEDHCIDAGLPVARAATLPRAFQRIHPARALADARSARAGIPPLAAICRVEAFVAPLLRSVPGRVALSLRGGFGKQVRRRTSMTTQFTPWSGLIGGMLI